jgi:hypothetical protein
MAAEAVRAGEALRRTSQIAHPPQSDASKHKPNYQTVLRGPFPAPIHLPRLPQGFLVPLPRLACCSVEQFVYLDWLIRSKPFEEGVHIRIGQHHLPVFGPKEAILYGPVEQGQ